MTKWTAADIPDQSGRTHVVTGANSGLGQVIATELARAGAKVIVACRDTAKGERAASAMPGNTEVRHLDLSDLASVRAFAAGVGDIAVLVNNAGVMATPKRQTKDGFELQIGTNHLGHFALTGLLLGRIADRVVSMSSFAHRMGHIDLEDLNWERRRYQRWGAYGQSKLANLQFTYELQRQLTATGSSRLALAAHPGYASTNLQSHTDSIQDGVMGITNRLFAQTAAMGALPALYAATVASIPGGSYVGPDGALEQRGYPKIVKSSRRSYDEVTAAGLWQLSEGLTGVTFTDF
jgi:NAD(P)-dependent dehydrogenase (short-subunit alcohol dehydrogenase family)